MGPPVAVPPQAFFDKPSPHAPVTETTSIHGWTITTVKGPIIADRDTEAFSKSLGEGTPALPEMTFDRSSVVLVHEASGVSISFSARDALRAWRAEDLPPLQVASAQAWRSSRLNEIEQQQAVQQAYDWTFTSPFAGTVSSTSGAPPEWSDTSEAINRGLLMERDPIVFYDEVVLYESDLDDNGVSQMTVKLRVMPKCWLVLARLWMRVDGLMVRLRESRLFCRHDTPAGALTVLRETRHAEGTFETLRAAGAPDSGPAYADADAASQAFQAVAPVGVTLFKTDKLVLPS
ncbi:hypothetical protein FOA52_001433 [Chlamydomonas sp. UWO 241]|nr:hypothetical protein FOA52_001433 [Chlamydomonas sp. UWO 241]